MMPGAKPGLSSAKSDIAAGGARLAKLSVEAQKSDTGVAPRAHFAHYNFVRVHRTLRVTPAMEARVSDRLWSLDELVERTSR
jgi:hypothetical protein